MDKLTIKYLVMMAYAGLTDEKNLKCAPEALAHISVGAWFPLSEKTHDTQEQAEQEIQAHNTPEDKVYRIDKLYVKWGA